MERIDVLAVIERAGEAVNVPLQASDAAGLRESLRIVHGLVANMQLALIGCENALADYVPTLERQGSVMGYGHAVLKHARATIASMEPPK